MMAGNVPTKRELVGHFDPLYADFKSEYPDQLRADEFLNEFAEFVECAEAEATENTSFRNWWCCVCRTTTRWERRRICRLRRRQWRTTTWRLGAWWTRCRTVLTGTTRRSWCLKTTRRMALTTWTLIAALLWLISKYAPSATDADGRSNPLVEHGFYTTVNMIRTLEDLLGLPPMNQNDALAAPISRLFSGKGDQAPFTVDTANRDNGLIYAVNPEKGQGAKESAGMDFSKADAADTATLNRVLWRNRMGRSGRCRSRNTRYFRKAEPISATSDQDLRIDLKSLCRK